MTRINNSWFTSETDEWATPQWLFDALDREFGLDLDPCATPANAKCKRFFTRLDSGLLKSWENAVVFMNPPYGDDIGLWMAKAHGHTLRDGATWHDYAMKHEVRLIRGRLKYGDGKDPAPFPSAIVVMRPIAFKLVGIDQKQEHIAGAMER